MISSLNGIISEINIDNIVIDVSGVGYMVACPKNVIDFCTVNLGKNVKILTEMVFRQEQGYIIYGFLSKPERSLFNLLTSVKGVGPKLAISVLSHISVSDFLSNISYGDKKEMSKIPGIGPKTAERIIVELKDKLFKVMADYSISTEPNGPKIDLKLQDALSALTNLGYSHDHVRNAIKQIDHSAMEIEDIIKQGLIILSQ